MVEDDEWLRKHVKRSKEDGKRKKKRKKGDDSKKRKKGKQSSSSSTTDESSRSDQVFRGPSSVGGGDSRAARDARLNPHHVLVESPLDTAKALPRSAGEGPWQQAEVYRKLPPLYSVHFKNVLKPLLEGEGGQGTRDSREVETVSETMDALLDGEPMKALMVLLGRRKAILASRSSEGGGWSVARYHEYLPMPGAFLTARDRENATKDFKHDLRLRHSLPGRGQSQMRGASLSRPRDGPA